MPAVLTIMFVVLTDTGSFAQMDADKMSERGREYLGYYCVYQSLLEKHWIAELEEKVSDGALDAIREKAVKDKDYKASSLSEETRSALRRRGRAIYKKKLAETLIAEIETRLFKKGGLLTLLHTKRLPEIIYTGDLPSKTDCDKFPRTLPYILYMD